jgi:ABC-type multidrug transport system ATPase subunit
MLCCETAPSDGTASIFGFSVAKDKFIVRQLVGVCKQDDYLYPNLTAREHLELFAGLRGVKDADLPGIVQEWLESVDLALVQDQESNGFSGGMKRRLSVACAVSSRKKGYATYCLKCAQHTANAKDEFCTLPTPDHWGTPFYYPR